MEQRKTRQNVVQYWLKEPCLIKGATGEGLGARMNMDYQRTLMAISLEESMQMLNGAISIITSDLDPKNSTQSIFFFREYFSVR